MTNITESMNRYENFFCVCLRGSRAWGRMIDVTQLVSETENVINICNCFRFKWNTGRCSKVMTEVKCDNCLQITLESNRSVNFSHVQISYFSFLLICISVVADVLSY